ncbi:hypothetical protein D3C85_1703090 [compost metagenome]
MQGDSIAQQVLEQLFGIDARVDGEADLVALMAGENEVTHVTLPCIEVCSTSRRTAPGAPASRTRQLRG